MFRRKDSAEQASFWIATSELPKTAANSFYHRLDRALAEADFGDAVRALCAPYYNQDSSVGGRPGIDPEVYFKMQMVGFFENLPSERAIAARCADSLSIREFLRYGLDESPPHHSSLTVIRQRLGGEVYERVFGLVLAALKENKLVVGKRLGVDASVIEANAALRSLEHRLSGDAYREYVGKLAEAAGVEASDAEAVRRFDRKRPGKKLSNAEWRNPHDPDAKIGRTKRGDTRMVHKSEHVVDLDTGAIVDADVRPGDEGDTEALTDRLLAAEARMNESLGTVRDRQTIESVTRTRATSSWRRSRCFRAWASRRSSPIQTPKEGEKTSSPRWTSLPLRPQGGAPPRRGARRFFGSEPNLLNAAFGMFSTAEERDEPRCAAGRTSGNATSSRRRVTTSRSSCVAWRESGRPNRRSRPLGARFQPFSPFCVSFRGAWGRTRAESWHWFTQRQFLPENDIRYGAAQLAKRGHLHEGISTDC